MNTPNKLTLIRIILIPVFMVFLLFPITRLHQWIALVIFVGASVTDWADGRIARSTNQVTTFGKFADPLADKLLTSAALISFIELYSVPSWMIFTVVAREFIVTGLRLVAISEGKVIAASMAGKIKTFTQMVAIVLVMLFGALGMADKTVFFGVDFFYNIPTYLMGIVAVITIYSGLTYILDNRKLLKVK